MKSVRNSPGKAKEDMAVAEVIGAVLIFAIVVSLFTTFVLWYVPTTATANENTYQLNSLNSFSSLESQIHSGTPSVGSSITQNMQLGINGVPPFSPSTDTEIFYDHSASKYSATSSFELRVNYTVLLNNSTSFENISGNSSSAGEIGSYGNTQFVLPADYYLQDGMLIRQTPQASLVTGNGPMPVSASNSSGKIFLGISSYNISGTDTSTSTVGTTLLNLQYKNITQSNYETGSTILVNGSEAFVNSITLVYFYYNITSSLFSSAIYNSLYQHYNNSSRVVTPSGLSSWNFTGLPMTAGISSNTIAVSLSRQDVPVYQFQSGYYSLEVLNL